MLRHLGYTATARSLDICTIPSWRAEEASPERIRRAIRDNLRNLARVLHFNAARGIALYRIGSQIIPFAACPGNPVPWWDEFAGDLEQIGQFVERHSLRLEMHPGYHCLLNAPSPETVALSILELGWHVRFLDALQVDASHKLAIRIGGNFGDKAASFDRFIRVIDGFPDSWKARLVIENDESCNSLPDVLEASEHTGLPAVFALRSHQINPGAEPDHAPLVARCLDTWHRPDGPAIVHLSSLPADRRTTIPGSERVEPFDLEKLMALTPADVPFDCLLEASQQERSVLDLRERMRTHEFGELPVGIAAAPMPFI